MNERYENAEMDVVIIGAEDVIATSPTTTSHYNPNCENEGPAGDAFL
ncbi:MAG: hypothetical protein IJB11_06250 [Oscillospiraceae bacterium]|nr:hypothetical protein [Oscillospiraceae bacterium]